ALTAAYGYQDGTEMCVSQGAQDGACGAQCAGALLYAGAYRPRSRRELYGFPQTDLGELRLGPRPGGLGLFADLAGRRADGAGGRAAVRSLWPAHRLFAGTAAARRRVPGGVAGKSAVAIPVERWPLRRDRHRLHRQRAEFDPARPLVRPAPADGDGDRLFRDRRRRAGAIAGVAASDRSFRLAR